MRKVIILLLTLCMLMAFTACNKQAATPLSDDTQTGMSTTSTVSQEQNVTAVTTTKSTTEKDGTANTDDREEIGKTETAGTTWTKKTRPTTKPPKTTGTTEKLTMPSTNATTARPTVATVEKEYATDRKLKVACVGDSITALNYWSNNLRGELSTANYTVSGFGKSGATALFNGVDYVDANTNAGKAYVNQIEYVNSMSYGADIVVIMLGTNDSKDVNWPYYGYQFVDDYIRLVQSYQNSSTEPMVFIALPPTVYSIGKFQGISNTRIEEYIIPALYEVASATGAIVIDTHTPTSGNASLMSDGVHPSDAGKAILCETIAAAIIADVGRE